MRTPVVNPDGTVELIPTASVRVLGRCANGCHLFLSFDYENAVGWVSTDPDELGPHWSAPILEGRP